MSTTNINIIITNGAAPHPADPDSAKMQHHSAPHVHFNHDRVNPQALDAPLIRNTPNSISKNVQPSTKFNSIKINRDLYAQVKSLAEERDLTLYDIARDVLQRYINANNARIEQEKRLTEVAQAFEHQPINSTAIIPVPGTSFKQVFIKNNHGLWQDIDDELIDLDDPVLSRLNNTQVLPQPRLSKAVLTDADMARLSAELTNKHA